MTLRLVPIASGAEAEPLIQALVPSFGGDEALPREIVTQTLTLLTADPRPDPWGSYIAHDGNAPIGIGAFKHGPDAAGVVEIAYMTFPPFEGRGYAGRMIQRLLSVATDGGAALVIAHTLPAENASNKALTRNGFAYAGEVMDPEDGLVWRWERKP